MGQTKINPTKSTNPSPAAGNPQKQIRRNPQYHHQYGDTTKQINPPKSRNPSPVWENQKQISLNIYKSITIRGEHPQETIRPKSRKHHQHGENHNKHNPPIHANPSPILEINKTNNPLKNTNSSPLWWIPQKTILQNPKIHHHYEGTTKTIAPTIHNSITTSGKSHHKQMPTIHKSITTMENPQTSIRQKSKKPSPLRENPQTSIRPNQTINHPYNTINKNTIRQNPQIHHH